MTPPNKKSLQVEVGQLSRVKKLSLKEAWRQVRSRKISVLFGEIHYQDNGLGGKGRPTVN